jgi:transposase
VITAIAPKLGCAKATVWRWVYVAGREAGDRPALTRADEDLGKSLGREVKELRRANDILRKVSADFPSAKLDLPGS